MEDIRIGTCRTALHRYQQVFEELAIVDGLVVRGEQLIIPQVLQHEVIQLAHEGHQGQDKTLQLMRQSTWFPNMGAGSSWGVVCHARQHRPGQRRNP